MFLPTGNVTAIHAAEFKAADLENLAVWIPPPVNDLRHTDIAVCRAVDQSRVWMGHIIPDWSSSARSSDT
jgi:hypothetical protein